MPERTWQAIQCPGEISFSTCSFCEQEGTRSEQRVWNRQPDGGLIGLGTSPVKITRRRPLARAARYRSRPHAPRHSLQPNSTAPSRRRAACPAWRDPEALHSARGSARSRTRLET